MKTLEIIKEIIQADVRDTVYENSLKVLGTFSNKQKAEVTDIYKSKFGTLIIEWKKDLDNEFSLEISTKDCGYFSTIDGKVKHISESGGEKTLIKDLGEFLNMLFL